jgi:hypothetical protein
MSAHDSFRTIAKKETPKGCSANKGIEKDQVFLFVSTGAFPTLLFQLLQR